MFVDTAGMVGRLMKECGAHILITCIIVMGVAMIIVYCWIHLYLRHYMFPDGNSELKNIVMSKTLSFHSYDLSRKRLQEAFAMSPKTTYHNHHGDIYDFDYDHMCA